MIRPPSIELRASRSGCQAMMPWESLADFYSHTGRPSVDPERLIRMLLVGSCFGNRSERRLCEEVHLNLV